MIKNKIFRFMLILLCLLCTTLMGCAGDSDDSVGGSGNTGTPSLEVLPADFQFVTVTDDNAVEPLEVTLRNNRTANLVVSDIALSGTDADQFRLDSSAGTNPCGSTPTIASGNSCTVTVYFEPQLLGIFSANLTIQSNDPDSPYDLTLQGTREDITEIEVKINQIEACPRANATVYVSVRDQAGFPVTGLVASDFSLSEDGGIPVNPSTAGFVEEDGTSSISIALVMDYSGSITFEPDNVTDMENAAISFIDQLGTSDEAEIIKYATDIEVTQAFTSDKALLIDAIQSTPDVGVATALYDAVVQAANDMAGSTKTRRAIIIITDGKDDDGTGNPQSDSTLDDAIAEANTNGVPVFTVGIGNAAVTVLQQLADETGGTYSDSPTSDNLSTIYQQLADLLFTDQYILTYNSDLASTATGDLTVTATYAGGVTGSDTKSIIECP